MPSPLQPTTGSEEYASTRATDSVDYRRRYRASFTVSRANDPVQMASAFANAVRAGRGSFLAGPMVAQETAVPSTPEIGRPFADGQLQSPRSIDSALDPRLPVQALV
jgi:hypothetical protein